MKNTLQRGDIWLTQLDPVEGSEQSGTRLVLIIQDDVLNTHSPITIGFCMTSHVKKLYATYVEVSAEQSGLKKPSIVMTNQVRTLSKSRLLKKLGQIDSKTMRKVEKACLITFGYR